MIHTRPVTLKHWLASLACCLTLTASSLQAAAPGGVTLTPIGTYATGMFDEAAAEIPAYDPFTQRLFVVNAEAPQIDVLDISNPALPTLVDSIDMLMYGGVANSVDIHSGVLAVAIEAIPKTDPGVVVFFDTATLEPLNAVVVGALPDMLKFSGDGRRVLTANEGEPNDDYSIDPEGSVSIIDLSAGVASATVSTADFTAFNSAALDPGIRIYGPGATVAQDLEPEYVAISADGKTAWVTLQENNAMAVIDVDAAMVTQLVALGTKDHSLPGNELDVSDKDKMVNITCWPVKGMYQPDAIVAYTVRGTTFLVMANEGDARDYDTFSEEARVEDLTLDPRVFKNRHRLQLPENLGRLKTTTVNGDADGDGRYEEVYCYGGRSFSIRTATGELVFDSGSQFEVITAALLPGNFNANNDDNKADARSDDKGPEPEGVALGRAFGRSLAFIGLERVGGVMLYDVSNPASPELLDYVNNRPFTGDPPLGDLGPEGLLFIPDDESPNGEPLLVVANEISGTTTIYQLNRIP